jgi:hypothetical protein
VLGNPILELYDSNSQLIGRNDNWTTTQVGGVISADQAGDIQASSLAPPNVVESAILAILNPGAYTAIVRGVSNTTGVALVEFYDVSEATPTRLGNISSRGLVQIGTNVMIAGFIVGDQTTQVIVRALGPTLTQFGVSGALADPTLDLRNSQGDLILANDNWKDTQQADITATGKAPPNDAESAILATLTPGNYTAIVRGLNNTTGVGLVEVYNLN